MTEKYQDHPFNAENDHLSNPQLLKHSSQLQIDSYIYFLYFIELYKKNSNQNFKQTINEYKLRLSEKQPIKLNYNCHNKSYQKFNPTFSNLNKKIKQIQNRRHLFKNIQIQDNNA